MTGRCLDNLLKNLDYFKHVKIYIGFQRIIIHKLDYHQHAYTTLREHMPEKHLNYNEALSWNADYFLSLAKIIRESLLKILTRILASKEFIEQTYNICIGLKRLSKIYGKARFEAACLRALNKSIVSYDVIKNILGNNIDKQEETQLNLFINPEHENIGGQRITIKLKFKQAFKPKNMNTLITLDHLAKLKLQGMARAYQAVLSMPFQD
jgi:hypothetical protein